MASDGPTNAGKHSVNVCSQRYSNKSVFLFAQLTSYVLMLRKFPPLVGPNVILNAQTDGNHLFYNDLLVLYCVIMAQVFESV